jgi:transcriptional regulator with XRE-family HTH domain
MRKGDPSEMKIGERIRMRRKEENLTRDQVAEKVQMSETSLFNYEEGKRVPRADDLRKIAKALNTTTSYLIGEIDNPSIDALKKGTSNEDRDDPKHNPGLVELLLQELELVRLIRLEEQKKIKNDNEGLPGYVHKK